MVLSPRVKTLKKILVPTDFSGPSKAALQEAVALARQNKAEIILLHVMEDVYLPAEHVLQHHNFPNVVDEVRKGCERQLQEAAATVDKEVGVQTRLRQGTPSLEIADEAEESQADVIVIASHGVRGLRRFLLGSTTERVVSIAPCTVIVAKPRCRTEPGSAPTI